MYRAGYPRVTHPSAALLRRESLDLHVLGTPPAFILSQDQTLMLKWCLCPASFIWHCLLLIRVACQSFDQLACSWISLKILEFSGLHYCLFVKDHNLLLRKSSFVRCCCSQRQLWYLIMSVAFCQQLFESFYLIQSGEGGIWTLAPLLTTCTLSRGVPSASLGTSPRCSISSNRFLYVTAVSVVTNGEGGIRTHEPLARLPDFESFIQNK